MLSQEADGGGYPSTLSQGHTVAWPLVRFFGHKQAGDHRMTRETQEDRTIAPHGTSGIRNPYGVMDVPNPNDQAVVEFAANVKLEGSTDDVNEPAWDIVSESATSRSIEGTWSSRWNGGQDPTIPGDTKEKWKQGRGEVRLVGDRVYLLFNWDNGARRGLIDAKVEDVGKLVGKYINLTAPEVTRPWIGLIVTNHRIDGRWTGGRLDFRR
jgi:hypothetical protein